MFKIHRRRVLIVGVAVAAIAAILMIRRQNVSIEGLFVRAVSVAAGEHPELAIPLFDDVLRRDPDHSQALLYRGQLTAQQGDPDNAISYFQRIGDKSRREAGTARYLEGMAWYAKGQARMAERQFLAAVALHPAFLKPRESLVQLYYIQARPAELQVQLKAIRELRIWNLEELFASQLAWFSSSLPLENISILEEFVSTDSSDVVSRVALAQHYLIHDRTTEAIKLLNDTKSLIPDNLDVHGLLAECHLDRSDIPSAWRQFQNDAPAVHNPTLWWRALGHCATEAEQWPEAITALRHAVAGNPNDYEAAYMLGIAAQRSGRTEFAEQELERARTTEKLSAAASILLKTSRERQDVLAATILDIGRLLLELRRPHEAAPWLSTFLAMRPNHPQALILWERANSQVDDAPDAPPAEVDPMLVAKIGSAIETADPKDPHQAASADSTPIRLRDIHEEIGLDFQYFNGSTSNEYILETVGGGVAVLDYDGDGWPDLFFPNGRSLDEPNGTPSAFSDELYRNVGGTRVDQVTQLARVSSSEFGQGCVAADYNNDGFQDLFVGTFGRILAYRNQGDGTFIEVAEQIGITGSRWTASLAMADLDRDGDLDLYVVNYVKEPFVVCQDDDGRPLTCSPANFAPEQDLLFINEGDGHFRDVTQDSGILAPNGKGLGVVIVDLDNDGWQDIYVANDGEQNFLFENQTTQPGGEPQFTEVGLVSGAAISRDARAQAGMGIACDDFDHNGWLDLYVTNFVEDYNTFYVNHGNALFSDETQAHGLVKPTMKTLGFGVQSLDLDLDGHGELVMANGPIHNRPIGNTPWQMPPHCFRRMSNGAYEEISEQVGPYFRGQYIGRALARLDFNQDHLPDAIAVHQDRPAALLVNKSRKTGNALVLTLCGVQSNRDGIGARIEFQAGQIDRVIEVTSGDGYYASNEHRMIIGVGEENAIANLTIRWPSGHVDQLTEAETNVNLMIVENRSPLVLQPRRGVSE